VYREPASPFVADFVGRVNVINAQTQGPGQLRIGNTSFQCPQAGAAQGEIKVYLRPEDVVADSAPTDNNRFDARVEKIEFLGSYCLLQVHSPQLSDQRLWMTLSPNALHERAVQPGATLALRMLPERMRVFA